MKLKKILSCAALCALPMSGGFAQDDGSQASLNEGQQEPYVFVFINPAMDSVKKESVKSFLKERGGEVGIAKSSANKEKVDVFKGRADLKEAFNQYVFMHGWDRLNYMEFFKEDISNKKVCGSFYELGKEPESDGIFKLSFYTDDGKPLSLVFSRQAEQPQCFETCFNEDLDKCTFSFKMNEFMSEYKNNGIDYTVACWYGEEQKDSIESYLSDTEFKYRQGDQSKNYDFGEGFIAYVAASAGMISGEKLFEYVNEMFDDSSKDCAVLSGKMPDSYCLVDPDDTDQMRSVVKYKGVDWDSQNKEFTPYEGKLRLSDDKVPGCYENNFGNEE